MLDYTADAALADIKLIACDMDYTLLDDRKTMPPNMPERIAALDAAGIPFCAASGRPAYTLRAMFPACRDRMGLISDNGAAVIYRGETVFKSLIDPADYHELLDVTLGRTQGVPVVCGLTCAYVLKRDRVWEEALSEYYHTIEYLDSFDSLDAEANKYTIYFPKQDSRSAYLDLFGPEFGGRFSVTNAGDDWIDVMNGGVDKGTGITRLCEYLGLSVADAAAFGDTDNDVQMLETAGHSFLMENGPERMRGHAKYLAPSCNDRGVAVVIDAILAAKGAR